MANDRVSEVLGRLGSRFEVRAILVGERLDVRALEPRLLQQLPVIVEVASTGCAVLLRAGAVIFFGVDPIQQERFIADLQPRIHEPYKKHEVERATVRVAESDGVDRDALLVRELSVERLQVIAEILGKSVILAHHESEIADAFNAIEPFALQMSGAKPGLPWRQRDLVRHIGTSMLVEHQLVGSAEVLEKPDLLWDNPELDRLYARLEDEYELRERHLVLERKLAVVSSTARTMLELHQTRRSLHVEYYIVGLIVMEIALGIFQLVR
jgi:uncharacterized Rmd1/YagE family protein